MKNKLIAAILIISSLFLSSCAMQKTVTLDSRGVGYGSVGLSDGNYNMQIGGNGDKPLIEKVR